MHISQQQSRSQNPNQNKLQGPKFVSQSRSPTDSSSSFASSYQGTSIGNRTPGSSNSYTSINQHRASQPHVTLSRQSLQSSVPAYQNYIPHSQHAQYNQSLEYAAGDSTHALPNVFLNPQDYENWPGHSYHNYVQHLMSTPNQAMPTHTHPNQNHMNQNHLNQNHSNHILSNQNHSVQIHHGAQVSPHQMQGHVINNSQGLKHGSPNFMQNGQFSNNIQLPPHQNQPVNQSFNNSFVVQSSAARKSASPTELNDAIASLNVSGNANKLSRPPSINRYEQYGVSTQ